MPQQTVNLGSAPDAGDGDTLRVGGDKINDNFTELYTDKLDKAGGTLTGDLVVPDEAYDATAWNGSLEVPTKNAVRDKIEALGASGLEIEDEGVSEATGVIKLNFVGAGVAAADQGGGEVEVTIPGGISTFALGDATDVDTTGAATGNALVYDGAQWEPGAVGGSVLLGTHSPSGVASVDIEDFSGLGYNKIRLECDLAFATDAVGLTLQYKLNGSYQSGAGTYRSSGSKASSSSSTNGDGEATGTSMKLPISGATWGIGNQVDENYVATIEIPNAGSSRNKRVTARGNYGAPSGANVVFFGGGTYEGTDKGSVLQGVRLAPTSGNFTGSIRVYGEM